MLEERLLKDLRDIGINVPFTLNVRGYSKTYFGRYDPNTNKVILYPYKTPKGDMYSYLDILLTAVHECSHCIQWSDPTFVRYKGIMHDAEFKKLYGKYSNRARAKMLFKEVTESGKSDFEGQKMYS